jgi:hypothetical protein
MTQSQKPLQSSSKRGLGWPWNNTAPEFAIYNDAVASGKIGWLFNWEMWKPDGTPDGVEYIPQVRVGDQAAQIDQFLSAIPRGQLQSFMAFNEPEIPSQANLSVAEAVTLWKQHVLPAKEKFGFRLGSPGVSSDAKGKAWLREFLSTLGGNDGIDFLVVHWYGTEMPQLASHLGEMYDTFKRPLWLTEFACTSMRAEAPVAVEQVEEFVKQTVPFLDACDFVERYAYFGAMKSVGDWVGEANCLHDRAGAGLTSIGKLYSQL